MKKGGKNYIVYAAVLGAALLAAILVFGTIWMGQKGRQDTEEAVRSVSLLFLEELAGRREQVVESNLQDRINDMNVAIGMLEEEDLKDIAHLQAYQKRMRQLHNLDKFAFVDENGLIYTSVGTQDNIRAYSFDYQNISEPEVSILNVRSPEKKVVIAIPADIPFGDTVFRAAFMEIDMQEMLNGVSLEPDKQGSTFCNIYTSNGVALTDTVLGGLAQEDNLLQAMERAKFEKPYSYDTFIAEFLSSQRGVVSFTYNDIRETLSFVPISGTNWMLTYLIRENVISERISSVSANSLSRSILQSVLTVAAMLLMFGFIVWQYRSNVRLSLESEKAAIAARVKQEEMEQRLKLQEQLLEQERYRTQQDNMITAMAADYRSVYYVDLDKNEAICYRGDPADHNQHAEGEVFPYYEAFSAYANRQVTDDYREGFLKFIDPEVIREGLEKEQVLAYRYLARTEGKEYYEMIRVAGVHGAGDAADDKIHVIGLGLTVIDAEMRSTMAQQQALSDALKAAEQASLAKTTFLSSMSHEIRTPMNAIIGLDSIALKDPDISETTRDYLEKIGSSAEHLLNLINDILDMSRIESGRMTLKNEEFSFCRMLEAINNMFSGQCQEKGLQYQCRIRGDVADTYIGDDMKLRQVLINVLGNAVKFTPEGGSVELTVERKAHFEDKTTLCFTVADTGIGMSEEFLPRIFDSFSQEDSSNTNRYGSSGLGLAITKNLVEMMNGSIQVESTKGKGSTFYVTVTLTDAAEKRSCTMGTEPSEAAGGMQAPGGEQPSPEGESTLQQKADLKGRRILLAEDVKINAEIMQMVLESREIEVDLAENGRIAVEAFAAHPAGYYDAILMDLRMPEMDGLEAAGRIRAMEREDAGQIPIIALTANAFDEDVQRSLQAGMNAHLSKPVQPELLYETLENLIRD